MDQTKPKPVPDEAPATGRQLALITVLMVLILVGIAIVARWLIGPVIGGYSDPASQFGQID